MPEMKFSYFPGCTAHSTSLEYSMSTDAVVQKLGIDLVDIGDWNCCGAAATHSINTKLSLCLPARNIALAQAAESGPLVIPCAGCFNLLKRAQSVMKNDETRRREIEDIVGFRFDREFELVALIDLFVNRIGLDNIAGKVKKPLRGLKTACYYGCALVRNPEVTGLDDPDNPRYLDMLMKSLGAEPVEWSFKTDCCGADLALTYGARVEKMVDRIVDMALEAGAQCLVTSCGLCQANLEMRQSRKVPVFYFTELMGIALDTSGRNAWWKKHYVPPQGLLKALNLA